MIEKFKTHIIYLVIIAISLLGVYYLYSKLKIAKQEVVQIQIRLNDSLKVYKDGNLTLYHRIVGLEDLNKDLSVILKSKDEKITSQFNTILKLNTIISKGLGRVDTVKVIDSNCVGIILDYLDKNAFRELKVKVSVNNPPLFETQEIFNPFGVIAKLTRNKEGIYGGYLEITPDSIEQYITVSDFDIKMDLDEYEGNPCDIIILKLAPSISFSLSKDLKSLVSIGGQALIKEAHLIGYEIGINNDYHWIRYSYFPSFLSF